MVAVLGGEEENIFPRMLEGHDNWDAVALFAESILRAKDRDDRALAAAAAARGMNDQDNLLLVEKLVEEGQYLLILAFAMAIYSKCVISPFVSGATSQQIPFIFLPLKGQIIHPSKEISFAGIQRPVCAVSGAKFLTDGGWIDLRNPVDTDVPFRLFRDEGRTFLQWVGESDLRSRMGGRLVLVHLMCREISTNNEPNAEIPAVFTPCVAFRVVGTPTKYLSNVSEVLFAPDAQASENSTTSGLSVSEYIAIGVCSILLALIYVASIFLYLHLRRRRKETDKNFDARDNQTIASVEEGVIKSNPLLGLGRHFSAPDNSFSDSGSSDTDVTPDIIQHHDDRKKNIQITSALVHPQHQYDSMFNCKPQVQQSIHQESTNIERLPEENVSIVETIEGREDRDTVKVIGTARRKLYFNPAYFEPQLLMAPPPAALEFLTKIREVISLAKQKMETKKFAPVLLGIPEEDPGYLLDPSTDHSKTIGSRRGSIISLKRENSRRRVCTGCAGCEPQDFKALSGKLPEFPSFAACHNCASTNTESKQISIRKWLEDVPIQSSQSTSSDETKAKTLCTRSIKRIRSPTRSLSPDHITPHLRTLSPKPASERARSPHYDNKSSSIKSSSSNHSKRSSSTIIAAKNLIKPKAPPPPVPSNPPRILATKIHNAQLEVQKEIHKSHLEIQKQLESQNLYDTVAEPCLSFIEPIKNSIEPVKHIIKPIKLGTRRNLPPPDMIHEAMVVDSKAEEPKIPTITKKKMNAVISQLASLDLKLESTSSPELSSRIDYDTDSLERRDSKGFSTPTDYGEVNSCQPSPSLSATLPMDEEMTMRNAIINTKTGNMTISKLNMDGVINLKELQQSLNLQKEQIDEHDYELIILKKNDAGGLFKLPELLQRSNGYSLVSEVYVNNGYNYGSAPSSPSDSNCSTLERPPKIIYEDNQPGHLLIEVEDCPDNYIRVEDSDSFEPDTLDRKPKMKLFLKDDDLIDSLERPNQILLRTTGSFKKEGLGNLIGTESSSHLNQNMGSLREIYEAKFKKGQEGIAWNMNLEETDFEGRILTLEERHCRRQRKSVAPIAIPPDVVPPDPKDIEEAPIYEQPKPPRKVKERETKPPIPPKNGSYKSLSQPINNSTDAASEKSEHNSESCDYEICAQKPNSDISILKNFIHTNDVLFKNGVNNQFILQAATITTNAIEFTQPIHQVDTFEKAWGKAIHLSKPDDSGYLSTDSNDSARKKTKDLDRVSVGSETDESLGDGHSESGAESIETHSVYFGRYKKSSYIAGSVDSGVGSDIKPAESVNVLEDITSSDSETVSYSTVVPLDSVSSRNSSLTIKKE